MTGMAEVPAKTKGLPQRLDRENVLGSSAAALLLGSKGIEPEDFRGTLLLKNNC